MRTKVAEIVSDEKIVEAANIRICNLEVAKEAKVGTTVTCTQTICNRSDYPIDIKTELITCWNRDSLINYTTVPAKPPNQIESYKKITNSFIMPDEPAILIPALSIKENEDWIFRGNWGTSFSVTPEGYNPFVLDYFHLFDYPIVCKVAGLDETVKFQINVTFQNLGNKLVWQQVAMYFRWADEWLYHPLITRQPTHGRGGFSFTCNVLEMPAEDAIIDFYLQHSDNSGGPWDTGIIKTAIIKPISEFGSFDITNLNTSNELMPDTKPDFFSIAATVSSVKKFFFLIKDISLIEDVTNMVIIEKEAEGNTIIELDPQTLFTKTMPSRDWYLSLYAATETR